MILILKLGLSTLATRTYRFRIVPVECPRGFRMVTSSQRAYQHHPQGAISEKNTYSCGPSSSYPAIKSATPNGLDMMLSSPSAPSPNLRARSQMA